MFDGAGDGKDDDDDGSDWICDVAAGNGIAEEDVNVVPFATAACNVSIGSLCTPLCQPRKLEIKQRHATKQQNGK